MNRRLLVSCLLLALAYGASIPLLAGEGRIPIWDRTVITASGKYIVTRNILPGPNPAIDVAPGVEHVDIDLNGFTLFGDPAGSEVIRAVSNSRSLTIRNGELRGQGGPFDALLVSGVGKVVLEKLKITDAGNAGISLTDVLRFVVRDNVVVASNNTGIFIDGFGSGLGPVTGTVAGNVVEEVPAGNGIVVFNGSSVAVQDNRVESVGGSGIVFDQCQACLIAENTIQDATANGIEASSVRVSKFYNNVVVEAASEGLALFGLSDDNLVLNNVIGSSGRNGILCEGSRNQIDQNVLSGNGTSGLGHGIWFNAASGAVGPNTYGRNTVLGNPGGLGVCAASVCAPPEVCDDTGNSSFGDNFGPGPC